MQVHFLTQCASSFTGVDEFPCQLVAENDIIGASTPFLFRAHIAKKTIEDEEEEEEKGKKSWNMKHENDTSN